jgi:hypothetical protein
MPDARVDLSLNSYFKYQNGMTYTPPLPGEPAPWLIVPSSKNPRYHFDSVAGRFIVLCFFGSAGNPAIAESTPIQQSHFV